MVRAVTLLIALGPVAACARPDYAQRWADGSIVSAGPQPGYAIKQVVEKQGPITLVGDDGSVCRTSLRRFADTGVDAWIACNWGLPGLDSTEVAALSRLNVTRR
jgi:hypothetical protein